VAAIWAIGAAAAMAARGFAPLAASQLPACTLHALTGVACPTCGSTRAALALARGEWGAALAANPLATLALAGFAAGALLVPLWAACGAPLAAASPLSTRALRASIAGVLAANWLFVLARGL
jgi:hypothetical protein